MNRGAGILMHISSLPNNYGIGTFGDEAYKFVDFLASAKQKYWQILPLCPVGAGDSPYQSPSAFALNPYFIDLELLVKQNLISASDLSDLSNMCSLKPLSFSEIYIKKDAIFKKAFQNSDFENDFKYEKFLKDNCFWLKDYSLFMTLKKHYNDLSWSLWDSDFKNHQTEALKQFEKENHREIMYFQFLQYIAYEQWIALKTYANSNGILIIGDIPIYVSYDSSDTWAYGNSGIFKLCCDLTPLCVAGCPPDYFSAEGQYWGNVLYDWDINKKTGYDWWLQRIQSSLVIYDWLRIDHFRGFESYWEIPCNSPNASYGHWAPGPGMDFINSIKSHLGDVNIIAEDLGFLTESVKLFLNESGFPGMKVLQFAFDSDLNNDNLPHNYIENCVAYTGTHDNDTTAGWLASVNKSTYDFANEYLKLKAFESDVWGFISGVLSSSAFISIIPMQDYLEIGTSGRMNIPSTLGGLNWKWVMPKDSISSKLTEKIAHITQLYGRQ